MIEPHPPGELEGGIRDGSRDWADWVSASRTRNWCLINPLQDWLELYGDGAGFERDPVPDPRTDFRAFIFRKGLEFEAAVLRLLRQKVAVTVIDGFERPTQSLEAHRATIGAMEGGATVIAQGVLWNPADQTYGAADLLARSDVLLRLFPEAITEDEARLGAPLLGLSRCHYRVIDIKFATLRLDRHRNAALEHLPYMAQVFIYNEALGRLQGYTPGESYLLGRSCAGPRGEEASGCFDRLARVPHTLVTSRGRLSDIVDEAVAWVRRVRVDGSAWHPEEGPPLPELRPNPASAEYPWIGATRAIAEKTRDPLLAWQVGVRGRDRAANAGVSRWTDSRFTAAVAGLTGATGAKLDQILKVNREPSAPVVSPSRIAAERKTWAVPEALEFYVDFETVSDVNDDFRDLPERGGQALIFMIGCGHCEAGTWRFECFIADELHLASEAEVIERWLAYMEEVRRRIAPGLAQPLVFHWSPAESSGLTNGLKSARNRHPERSKAWPEPRWFDFLGRVMRAEPVIVKGPMGFGLKTVARSLKHQGLIDTDWDDNLSDGLGAMVGAWHAYQEAQENGSPVAEHALMQAAATRSFAAFCSS